jgi:hypothetical protein
MLVSVKPDALETGKETMTNQALTYRTIEKMEIAEMYCYKQMLELFLCPDNAEAFSIVNKKCFFTKSTQITFRGLVSL